MFDEIVNMVKHQIGNNPQVASAIPAGQEQAVHQEVASQITQGLAGQAATQAASLAYLTNCKTASHPAALL